MVNKYHTAENNKLVTQLITMLAKATAIPRRQWLCHLSSTHNSFGDIRNFYKNFYFVSLSLCPEHGGIQKIAYAAQRKFFF